jgi:hypothetical protein
MKEKELEVPTTGEPTNWPTDANKTPDLTDFLNLNMRALSGIQLRQLMPTSWNASSRGLRPSVLIVSFLKSISLILLLWRS